MERNGMLDGIREWSLLECVCHCITAMLVSSR